MGTDDATGSWPQVCHHCGRTLELGSGSFFVVRIEATADPSPPRDDIDTDGPTASELLAEMREMSERELMDDVHQRFELRLCRPCYRSWSERGFV